MKTLACAATLLLMAGSAMAQPNDEAPAVDTSKAAPRPTVNGNQQSSQQGLGLVIEEDQETPFGLVIAPWINAQSERDIDRPARLLQEEATLVDRLVLARQIEYYDALTEAAQAKKAAPKP